MSDQVTLDPLSMRVDTMAQRALFDDAYASKRLAQNANTIEFGINQIYKEIDTNRNGQLSRDEIVADENHSGAVSASQTKALKFLEENFDTIESLKNGFRDGQLGKSDLRLFVDVYDSKRATKDEFTWRHHSTLENAAVGAGVGAFVGGVAVSTALVYEWAKTPWIIAGVATTLAGAYGLAVLERTRESHHRNFVHRVTGSLNDAHVTGRLLDWDSVSNG